MTKLITFHVTRNRHQYINIYNVTIFTLIELLPQVILLHTTEFNAVYSKIKFEKDVKKQEVQIKLDFYVNIYVTSCSVH